MTRTYHLITLFTLIASASFNAQAQSVIMYLDNEVWMDNPVGTVTTYTAVNSTWDVSYSYSLDVRSTLSEDGMFRGSCHNRVDNYPVVNCYTSTTLNSGSTYFNHGYHVVTATKHTFQSYNASYGSLCWNFPSTCWDDMYGYDILDNNPSYPWIVAPPEFVVFYDPVSPRTSREQSQVFQLETMTTRRAPSGLTRDYLLEYKAFIPYDNVPSPAPGDVCIGGLTP
jgi:hypothetical protein